MTTIYRNAVKSLASLILLLTALQANAQFDQIRKPQEPEEISLYKQNNVRAELQKTVDKGVWKNYRARAFDAEGRVLGDVTYFEKKYYLYDDKGRVSNHIDSIRIGETENFAELMYAFQYDDASGIPVAVMSQGNGESKLSYDAKKKILTERYKKGDTTYTTYYFYDAYNRLMKYETYDMQNKINKRFERALASNGKVYKEISVEYIPSGGKDSTLTYYIYNSDMQLAKKQVYTETVLLVTKPGESKPSHSAKQTFLENWLYKYDEKGRKISEEYEHSIDKFSSRYSTWQYNDRGLVTKATIQQGKTEPRIFIYEYIYGN